MSSYLKTCLWLCAAYFAVSLFQWPDLFEEGMFDHYTSSILEDGDFNLINSAPPTTR
ncbi:MAG TPA: hypothetical protein VM598_12560 [Bdellovibrionota bacterium]|nr:hypothetical protein [Bdellovibrionota bacterium]